MPDVVYVDSYMSPDTRGLKKTGSQSRRILGAKERIQRDLQTQVLSGADAWGEGAAGGIRLTPSECLIN